MISITILPPKRWYLFLTLLEKGKKAITLDKKLYFSFLIIDFMEKGKNGGKDFIS